MRPASMAAWRVGSGRGVFPFPPAAKRWAKASSLPFHGRRCSDPRGALPDVLLDAAGELLYTIPRDRLPGHGLGHGP